MTRRWRRRLVWLVPALLAGGLGWLLVPSSPSGAQVGGAPGPTAAATAAPADGAALYRELCSSCHGADGKGTGRGPSLAGVGSAEVDFQLQTGRMPKRSTISGQGPFTPQLSQAEITALDRYVTALVAHGGPEIPSVDPTRGSLAEGGELYRTYCAACHDEMGRGGELVDRPVPAITEATPQQVAEAVRAGAVQMPRFGTAAISPSQLNSIAAYVDNLKHADDAGGDPLSHVGPVAEGIIAWFVGMLVLLGLIRWIGQRG